MAKQRAMNQAEHQEYTRSARLRILETTDLHMHLLDYDYFADQKDENYGLIRLLDLITKLRSNPDQTSLLFDNGDFIQGNPLADYLAAKDDDQITHPIINAFNALEYDAVTLGNHEFNYGLPFLRQSLSKASFPIVCANIDDAHDPPLAQDYLILDRVLACTDGTTQSIKIGVVGFVTPKITEWDHDALNGKLTTEDIVDCPKMKKAGADIIVALCHAGIGPAEHVPGMENPAVPLAALEGIDVLLTGHTHEVFPDETRASGPDIDPVAGTLHGKPTVMAGFYGNRLGMVDLALTQDRDGWRITDQHVALHVPQQPTTASGKLQQQIIDGLQGHHLATLSYIRQPVSETAAPIHTYFSTILPDLGQQLLANAQSEQIRNALAGTDQAHLPIISATSPFLFGGRSGPGHYIDIAPGPVTLRDAAAIYPFANTLCASKQSGASLREWLERAAAHFAQLTHGATDQTLTLIHSPGYDYDTLFGLQYEIDLLKPARYSVEGVLVNDGAARIRNLTYQGRPVEDDEIFILAANSYRTYGGGNYPAISENDIIYRSTRGPRDILVAHLRSQGTINQAVEQTSRFAHIPQTSATFLSSPRAQRHLTKEMKHIGPAENGFHAYQLAL